MATRRNYAVRNPAAPVSKGPRIRIAYETWTPEDVEFGDTDDTGWLDEEGVSMRPDEYDQEEGRTVVDMAVKFLREEGATEPSSSRFHKGIWYTAYESPDFRTGEQTVKSYHLVGFSEARQRAIFEQMRRRR